MYKVEHRLVYDPARDDVLVARWLPFLADEDVVDRVSRPTFAHSTRGYPRTPPSVQWGRRAVIKDPHPTFQVGCLKVSFAQYKLCMFICLILSL
jgi:hypothetical protein